MTRRRDRLDRYLLGVGVLLGLAVLAALVVPLFPDRMYLHDDLGHYHFPLRVFYQRALLAGDAVEWVPNLYCGFYLHGEGQVGMYHPLHLLLYGLLPVVLAFNLEVLLSYPLMVVGMFLFLRRFELPRSAALFGGLLFATSSFNLLHLSHPNAVAIGAHIPWLLWGIELAVNGTTRRTRILAAVLVGGLTASQLLKGYPQYVYLSGVAEVLYVLLRLAWRQPARLALLTLGKLLGVVAGLVQLLPTWELLNLSRRAAPDPTFLQETTLHPLDALQLLGPYLFEGRSMGGSAREMGIYAGLLFPLALLWFWHRRAQLGPLRPLVLGAAGLCGLALVLGVGHHTPVQPLLAQLPGVGLFRGAARHAILLQLGAAVLGACLLADLLRLEPGASKRPPALLWVPTAAIAVAGLGAAGVIPNVTTQYAALWWGALSFGAGAILVMAAAGRPHPWLVAAILTLGVADTAGYGLSFLQRFPTRPLAGAADIPLPPPGREGRIHWGSNPLLLYDLHMTGGYSGLVPTKQLDGLYPSEISQTRMEALRIAGVAWVQRVEADGSMTYHPVPAPLDRVRLVSEVVVAPDPDPVLGELNPRSVAVVAQPVPIEPGIPGQATLLEDRPGQLTIQVAAPGPRLLVVSESYHPGWQVEVDGQPAEVVPVYGDFMGCVVQRSSQQVRFHFQPQSLRWGRWLSLFGLAGLLCLALIGLEGWKVGRLEGWKRGG